MDVDASFWTEIDQVSRRRRMRRAIGAVAAVVTVGGTMTLNSSVGALAVQMLSR